MLAQEIAERYGEIAVVEAVAMAGSRSSGVADADSDIDLYVYIHGVLSLEDRAAIATNASRKEIGNAFWEPGDEWVENGASVDVMFRQTGWIEEQMDRVLLGHEGSVGYSTCFWYNVLHSEILVDRNAWFAQLQTRATVPYPPELKQNIVAKNWPILRNNVSSYRHQIELALRRGDVVSVQHRVTALLASYFDVLFAINEQPHPGEKRLLTFAEELCPIRPQQLREQVTRVVDESSLAAIDALLDGLEPLLP
jgi:Nucleotidyltransferase domain